MGLAIERDRFEDDEFDRFRERLDAGLRALAGLLERPGFGEGETSLGAELELSLVGADGRPLPVNQAVLRETLDPRMTFELDRFNLESNLLPAPMAGRPFTHLRDQMRGAHAELSRAAGCHGARVAMVGILPTLRETDLGSNAMTDTPRYRALSWSLQRSRHEPFALDISGQDRLEMSCDDVTFEGAATSLQIHLRVDPARFCHVFNAVQLATPPALAVSANSPTFLGRRLWDETRVALFKQAVDVRATQLARLRQKPRVFFGADWNRGGAYELFEEAVRDFPPLLPVLSDEDPEACVRSGALPHLGEIRLHQGTVWSWNRPVYDPADGGHLRVEMRALPAGPSIPDMAANAAFLVGLALGLAEDLAQREGAGEDGVPGFTRSPFHQTHHSFYRAAQYGLDARIQWPEGTEVPAGERPARDLVPALLPLARRGLAAAGVADGEAEEQLALIAARCAAGTNGATWQRTALEAAGRRHDREAALVQMLEAYLAHSASGLPVHEWPADA